MTRALSPFVDDYGPQEWLRYLATAVKRETGEAWFPPRHEVAVWVRGLKGLETEDRYRLACALDLLATSWDPEGQPWQVLSPGFLLRPVRLVARSAGWWRAVWFSRFASTDAAARYYVYWLDRLEDVADDPRGFDRRGHAEALAALDHAERLVRGRQGVEPAFNLHLLRYLHRSFSGELEVSDEV